MGRRVDVVQDSAAAHCGERQAQQLRQAAVAAVAAPLLPAGVHGRCRLGGRHSMAACHQGAGAVSWAMTARLLVIKVREHYRGPSPQGCLPSRCGSII